MEGPKQIVILGSAWPLRGGGLATFNERLAREFIREGHQVTIYTFSLQYPSFLFPGTSQLSGEKAPADLDIKVAVNSINPLNWVKTGREICRRRPDLLIVRYWLPFLGPALGTITRKVRRNNHTKVICIADNVIPHEKRPGDKMFTRYFLKPVDAFITLSEKVLADLKQFAPSKKAVFIPHPLYDNFGAPLSKAEARTKLGLPTGGKLVLFFGFIRAYKGLDILFRAMADQRIRDLHIHLLVAGEYYQDSKPYIDLIDQLQIGDRVILRTDFVKDDEVRYYCSAADLIVQPYRHATQSGVTPLAYHFEKPMIVTNVGGLPAMVPDGKVGLIAEPNPESLADHIVRFYELGEDHFLPHLREEKKKYAWDRLVKAILDLADGIQK